jgi:hypothetical protein
MASASPITHPNRRFTLEKGHPMTDEMLRAAEHLATAVDNNFSCDYQQIVQAHHKNVEWAGLDHPADLVELS